MTPATLDLTNSELIAAHLHSTWLAAVGLLLDKSMAGVLDLDTDGYPLQEAITVKLFHPPQGIGPPPLPSLRDAPEPQIITRTP